MRPVRLKQETPETITISWDDGLEVRLTLESLRRQCPCASCLQESSQSKSEGLFILMQAAQTKLVAVEQSGRNAVIFVWGDGHRTGIYTWEYLRCICEDFQRHGGADFPEK